MKNIKIITTILLFTLFANAQTININEIAQHIQNTLYKVVKGKNRAIVESIYAQSAYKPLWTGGSSKRKTSQFIQALNDPLYNYKGKSFDQKSIKKLLFMLDNNQISNSKRAAVLARLDLIFTNSMVRLVRFIVQGDVDWDLVQNKIKALKDDADIRADWEIKVKAFPNKTRLVSAIINGNIKSYLNSLLPMEKRYRKLVALLKGYKLMDKFPKIEYSKLPFKKGDWSSHIPEVKKRLQITGDYPKNADLSWTFNESLERAIKTYQKRYLLKITGKLDKQVAYYLNQPVKKNIQAIITNLDKTKIYPKSFEIEHVEVNIPDFNLRYYKNGRKISKMGVVVGRLDRPTPLFSDYIEYMVLNPTWTITDNLVKKDLIPVLQDNPEYLSEHNIHTFSGNKEVSVNYGMLQKYIGSKRHVPYRFVQYPGENNALGKVKFMFPNKYSVYLHDTDDKSILSRRYKLYSSGCVRVDKPFELMNILLKNAKGSFSQSKIDRILESNKTTTIRLRKSIPVHMLYFTVYEEDGLAYFKHDIYSYDRIIEESVPYNRKATYTLPKVRMVEVKVK